MTAMPITVSAILDFLSTVDLDFPIPLSHKQPLEQFAQKLCSLGTICAEIQDGRIPALAAGYTDNTPDRMGYLSIVAARKEHGEGDSPPAWCRNSWTSPAARGLPPYTCMPWPPTSPPWGCTVSWASPTTIPNTSPAPVICI